MLFPLGGAAGAVAEIFEEVAAGREHHRRVAVGEQRQDLPLARRQALADGGEELDMVVNISKVLSGDWPYVKDDIRGVVEATHAAARKVKVIFENAYLNDDQKIRLCEICAELRADWVKTSTGYAPTGATDADLMLMRKHSPPSVQVKAAGGIRDLDTLLRVRALGVTRCGATRTASMMDEARRRLDLPAIAFQGVRA